LLKNMQRKNVFCLKYSALEMFSQSLTELANQTTFMWVVFSEKSDNMNILASATFVVFWKVSLLSWFLTTLAVDRMWKYSNE
jgi:hypothetical protein